MLDIAPRLTYSPEGILQLSRNIDFMRSPPDIEQILEDLNGSNSKELFAVAISGSDLVVGIDIPKALHTTTSTDAFNNTASEGIIDKLGKFTYYAQEVAREGVFSLDYLGHNGGAGIVHSHFQRWLNADLFTEELAREVVDGMALPFNEDIKNTIDKQFRFERYSNGVGGGAGGMSINVALLDDNFKLHTPPDTETPNGQTGTVNWRWPNISTVGDCACWGVSGEDRERVYMHPENLRLYEIHPHNVDMAAQSLSLVLGVGRLAYEAAQYEGEEDIFENVSWEEA